MAKKGLTQTQKDYNKAYKNVINRIEKMKSQGYVFSDKQIPKKLSRPQQKSIENLKKLTKKELASQKQTKFTYKDESGQTKTVSGSEGLKIQQSEAGKKGWEKRRKKDSPPIIPLGEIILNELYALGVENQSNSNSSIRRRATHYLALLDRLSNENHAEFIKHLEALNKQEVFEVARKALKYYYGDDSEGWAYLDELEFLLTNRALTLAELQERQTQADREEFAEYDDTEPLPFW